MKTPNLVIGASGQIGQHCLTALNQANPHSSIGTYKDHLRPGLIPLDVTDVERLESVVQECEAQVIYLMGCEPNVDYCEEHPDSTYEVNVLGVRNAVDVANRHGCTLVFMSSEYIFDGAAGPYEEREPARPLSVYGWQKVASEHYVATNARDWLVIRTGNVYGWESQGKNFVARLRRMLTNKQPMTVPFDQISTPTYAPDLVSAIVQLVEQNERGVFNVCGSKVVSRYDFARAAAAAFNLDAALIMPVVTVDLHQRAPRPLNAGLIVMKVETTIGRPMLDHTAGLNEMAATAPAS